jgi:hypothetical protein
MSKCDKCKAALHQDKKIHIQGGESFQLCSECSCILDTFPTSFLITNFLNFGNNPIENNMLEARKNRVAGISLWD